MMEWVNDNAAWLIPTIIIIADKIVMLTPNKWDDLIVTGLKKLFFIKKWK